MKHLLQSICIVVVSQIIVLNTANAQELIPEFPQADQTVTLLDLLDGGLGLRWTDTGTPTNYIIEFRNPTNAIPQLQFLELNATASPYYLDGNFRGRFLAGSYSWLVRTADGSRTSGLIPFTINSTGLQPTPGPAPEPPSGDLNGSSAIDKSDLYLLASNWKRNLFDPYAADFNLDGEVDQRDLLVLASRFGDAAVPPTPSPEVGLPGNITFSPNDVIGFAELANFKITWDPPQYPENVAFYEIVIISQFGQEIVSMRFLERREFSLSSLTQDGTYQVYIRAKTTDGTLGNIANAQFTIDPTRTVTPTPNSGMISLDYNNDGLVNEEDSRLFVQAFGTFNGDSNFQSGADFNQDGFIDILDLEVYQASYPNPPAALESPTWNAVIRPILMAGSFGSCVPTGNEEVIPADSLEVIFPSSTCMFAELFEAQFAFNAVENAIDYFYIVYLEGEEDNPLIQGFTKGETFFTDFSVLLQNTTFMIEIQTVNEGLQFSNTGTPLRFTVPPFSNG